MLTCNIRPAGELIERVQTFQQVKCYTSFISFNNYSLCLRNYMVTVLKKLKWSFLLTDFFFVLSWKRKVSAGTLTGKALITRTKGYSRM